MNIITSNKLKMVNSSLVGMYASVLLLVSLLMGSAHAMEAPDAVVKSTVDKIVGNIQENRATYKTDTRQLYKMVRENLVPAIHVDRMSGLILGNNAKTATAAQKSAFSTEFETFLIRSYATALLDYSSEQKVIYQPVTMAPGDDKVKISAELVSADGQKYSISLYMSNRGDTQWRAYNMQVSGINFVTTYRANFGGVIAQKGLDGLIADLKQKNAKLAS